MQEDTHMANAARNNTDAAMTYKLIRANVTSHNEAKQIICGMFALTTDEFDKVLKNYENYTSEANKEPKRSRKYTEVKDRLFKK